MSSIENDHERETAEVSADQTAIDGSVGSDTETSRPFTSDPASKDPSEGPHHARSNSVVKKPSTFKAVSVTKNFLAKAGSTAAPAAKGTGDNGILCGNSVCLAIPTDWYGSLKFKCPRQQCIVSRSTAACGQNRQRTTSIYPAVYRLKIQEWRRSRT